MHPLSEFRWTVPGLLAAGAVLCVCAPLFAQGDLVISQRDKQFNPDTITIEKGHPLTIVNDDGATVHHAYVESDVFNFDSGDQDPGGKTTIVFPVKGDFEVLCGIHPRMKLAVHVK